MPKIKRVPGLSKKTPAQRGPVDPDSLSAAINWDKIMSPDLFDLEKNAVEITKSDTLPKLAKPSSGRLMIPQLSGVPLSDLVERGGSTSGNWGHAGRPGIKGGSVAGGGHTFFPVIDRAKLGGHAETDLLGMVTLRRQEMGTVHAGTKLGRIKGTGSKAWTLRWKINAAREAAELAAGRKKYARLEAERQVKIEGEKAKHDPAGTRKALGDLEVDHQPRIDTQKAALTKAQDVARMAKQDYNRMTTRGFEPYPDVETGRTRYRYFDAPSEGVDPVAWEQARAKYDGLAAARSLEGKKLTDMRTEYLEAQRALVTVDNPVALNAIYKVRGFKREGREATWNAGRDAFQTLVSADLQPDGFTANFRKGGKGRSSALDDDIRLTVNANAGTVVHELGHIVEHQNPMVLRSAQRFLNYRTQGEESVSLRSATGSRSYSRVEKTKVDKFMHAYMGKSYLGATEITSMGLDYMYSKPAAFAKADPGMFDMVYNVARGVEWYPPKGE